MYKQTLFDRYGPDAVHRIRALAYGITVGGTVAGVVISQVGFHWWTLPVAVLTGAVVGNIGWLMGEAAGATWKHVMVDGSSTPYVEQFSYQQALVMKGEIDEALTSFEAVIDEQPTAVVPRIKAAELYSREKRNYARAAELFRQVQRIEAVSSGDDIYATNRLVDLHTGPLGDPGRALVELRRLVDRYPGSPAAEHARTALAALKARARETAPA